jgi:hypothetical protein
MDDEKKTHINRYLGGLGGGVLIIECHSSEKE